METSVRILTSEGRGAIAVVRVWGIGAVAVVDRVFRPARGKPIADTMPGRLRLGLSRREHLVVSKSWWWSVLEADCRFHRGNPVS